MGNLQGHSCAKPSASSAASPGTHDALALHEGAVVGLATDTRGELLFSCSDDKTISVLDWNNPHASVRKLVGHSKGVNKVTLRNH